MLTAILLINCARDKINETAQQLVDMRGVTEVYSISGNYDLAAIIRVKSPDDLAEVVTNQLLKISSIQKTETMIAFRSYSRIDLEQVFTVGA